MIEELLKSNKISPGDFDLYQLYQVNELGRKCLNGMMHDSYMDEPKGTEFSGVGFAFYDGRRSVFRDINRAITRVQEAITKGLNDDSSK